MSSNNERVLRDVLNSAQCRGLELNWAGTDSHLFLRGVVEGFEVVVGPSLESLGRTDFCEEERRDDQVFVLVYDLGDFDEGREPVTTVEGVDRWTAAQVAWLLGVAYRQGRNAPKPLVG